MKKNYKNLLVAFSLAAAIHSTAQLTPNYSFSNFTGSYSAISGGTVFGNSFSDDQSYVDPSNPLGGGSPATGVGLPIGFNFTFNGNVYDVIGINNNGWISLGQSALGASAINDDRGGQSTFNNPMAFSSSSAPQALQAKIAGFATDMVQQSSSTLRMQTLGSSPNQTLVVQFASFRGFSHPGESLDFQIRLYETSNIIDVVYGAMTITGTSGTCQVGLRGSASSADFKMLDVSTSNSWASPNQATSILANADFINLQPVLGLTYRWTPPPVCSTAPPANTVVATSTMVCPGFGITSLGLATNYTTSGISYQWQFSTFSGAGPFVAVPNGTTSSITTPTTNVHVWYRAVATCSTIGTTSLSAVSIDVAGTTTNSVPYFESFEGTNSNFNLLPNCSWIRTDTTHCKTSKTANFSNRIPRTGSGYANFDGSNGGATNFEYYSNGIQLNAGVTYSAAVWLISPGFSGFTNFSLRYGPNQSSTGLITLGTVSSPQNSNYTSLSNTFVVASSGIYYLSVAANSNFSFSFLTFDDLSLTAPCFIAQNAVPVSLIAPTTVCFGETTTLTATGAGSYTWDSGSNSNTIIVTPTVNTTYSVSGTNILSGCTNAQSAQVLVNPIPALAIIPSNYQVCAGSTLNITATGANSYNWSNGANTSYISVAPGVTTTYSVVGINLFGCSAMASQAITTHSLPVISVIGNTTFCVGDGANFKASGASSYVWKADNLYLQSANIYPIISASRVYTVTGTDAFGCSGTTLVSVIASECTGISTLQAENKNAIVFPNPGTGVFTLQLNNGLLKTVELIDLAGRVVLTTKSDEDQIKFNITDLENGIYYVKVSSVNFTQTLKIIKQ